MSDKNIEMMKKLIEEKKRKSLEKSTLPRASMSIGESRKALKRSKKGGLFDK